MKHVEIQTQDGKTIRMGEELFLRNVLAYLREHSPDRAKIIAQEINDNGRPKPVATMVMMLLKNPQDVKYYTEILPIEKEGEND